MAGLEEGEGKQDAPERRVAAQGDGRIQPLGFGLRPARTASEGMQAPKTPATSSLPKKAASSVCSPAPPLWLFPSYLPAGLFFVSLTGFSYFSPLHWSTGPCFLSFSTPPPRSMESTPIHPWVPAFTLELQMSSTGYLLESSYAHHYTTSVATH